MIAVTKQVTFNQTIPKRGSYCNSPCFNDIESFKYADYDYVIQNVNDDIAQILKSADIVGDRKRIVVDIKVHDLDINDKPAINGWHIDCTNNPLHNSRPEHHHIFVVGKCLTEFPLVPITLNIDGKTNFDEIVDKNIGVFQIASNTFYTYGRFHLHRASIAKVSEKRLLIRITETDIIKPNNKPFKPFVKNVRSQSYN